MLADLRTDTFKRIRASYVIAADGGSSPTRGQLGIGYSGRTYAERWVVIDTKVLRGVGRATTGCGSTATPPVPPSTARPRWVTTAGSSPPATDEDEQTLLSEDSDLEGAQRPGHHAANTSRSCGRVIYSHHVRVADRWRVGRVFLAGDAAHAMPPWIGQGMSRRRARRGEPVLEARRGAQRTGAGRRCSTPTRPNASRTSSRSPAAPVSSAASSPSATAVIAAVRNHVLRALPPAARCESPSA